MPSHTHVVTSVMNCAADGRPGSDTPVGNFLDSGTAIYAAASDGGKMADGAITSTCGPAGGSQPVSVQNPILGINYIIATEGIFPSRN